MLSTQTLDFLNDLCERSHALYTEGGVLWTYVEAAKQAHTRFNNPRRKPAASPMNVDQLGSWLQAALGEQGLLRPAFSQSAEKLLCLLRADLHVDQFLWSFDIGADEMSANIYMVRHSDNRFFALMLWWSQD